MNFHVGLLIIAICALKTTSSHPVADKTNTTQVHLGDNPFHCVIRINTDNGDFLLCEGALIDKKWALTAAGCVDKYKSNPDILEVVAGIVSTENIKSEHHAQKRKVVSVNMPPSWTDSEKNAGDIALLKFRNPMRMNKFVNKATFGKPQKINDTAQLVGYGEKDELSSIELKIVSGEEYLQKNGNKSELFCAKKSNSNNIFDDESYAGAPLAGMKTTSPKELCGIFSAKRPYVFTSTAFHKSWIEDITGVKASNTESTTETTTSSAHEKSSDVGGETKSTDEDEDEEDSDSEEEEKTTENVQTSNEEQTEESEEDSSSEETNEPTATTTKEEDETLSESDEDETESTTENTITSEESVEESSDTEESNEEKKSTEASSEESTESDESEETTETNDETSTSTSAKPSPITTTPVPASTTSTSTSTSTWTSPPSTTQTTITTSTSSSIITTSTPKTTSNPSSTTSSSTSSSSTTTNTNYDSEEDDTDEDEDDRESKTTSSPPSTTQSPRTTSSSSTAPPPPTTTTEDYDDDKPQNHNSDDVFDNDKEMNPQNSVDDTNAVTSNSAQPSNPSLFSVLASKANRLAGSIKRLKNVFAAS